MFFTFSSRLVTALFVGLMLLWAPVSAYQTDKVNARPALWQIKKDGGTVYLLGSFHILPRNYVWFDGIIRRSFEPADELVMEAVMTPDAMAGIQEMALNNAFFTGEDNLQDYLDDAHYTKMLGHAKRLMGLDEAAARKSKPWFMAIQISLISVMSNGMDPDSGVDKYLESQARQGKKVISGLETPKEAMFALIDHPLPVQAAMLADTLDKLDNFKSYIKSYLDAWASGDADRMDKTMVEDMAEQPAMYQTLLVDRNENWMPAIEAHINSGKTIFIVVGAAHLVGKDGIVRMLRDKGYPVDKIQ